MTRQRDLTPSMLAAKGEARDFILDEFTPYRIVVLGNTISKLLASSYAEEFNITIPEWRVLAVVCQFDGVTASTVTEKTPMDKVAVSRAVTALVDKGYVIKAISQDDRRAALLTASREGRSIFEEIAKIALGLEAQVLNVLSDEERSQLKVILNKLLIQVSSLNEGD